jgi:predicted ATPase/DNA-binding SARP family transcriptional activator
MPRLLQAWAFCVLDTNSALCYTRAGGLFNLRLPRKDKIAMLYRPWHITLLGTLSARSDSLVVTRFRTRQTGMLLACLALCSERSQSREELADRLWPDEAVPEAGRTNLRVALSSLRRQLEPPGVPAGSVLVADRNSLRLRPQSFTTDIGAFQAALRPPCEEEPPSARAARLSRAVALYGGELLPGGYDDWILRARESLAAQYRRALGQLFETWEALGELESARECANRLIEADPLEETGYLALMRLSVEKGEPAKALREFERLERLLRAELGAEPSEEARNLVALVRVSSPAVGDFSKPAAASPLPPLPAPAVETLEPLRVLPLSWTRFFGREAEQAALRELLTGGRTRLVTLTGPGGAGKTRLATEVGQSLAQTFPGPICFVPLADILSAPHLPEAIAAGLRLPPFGTGSSLDQITEALAGQQALLLLDNLEQIADGAAPIVQSLLARLPGLRCLVTSRRSLHLPGERVFPLPPLPTPLRAELPEGLLTYAGVQLFVDRAQAVRPDFQITPGNAEAIRVLCDRLEGLPLALELAATWTGVLTPAQALARLDERFALMVSRKSEGVKRHRTLHAAIMWSFELLPADLRCFFLRLSVFRGGWTSEAAEAVCEQAGVLEALGRLRERSLILAEEVDGGALIRFRMLESLREFADDQCSAQEAAETQQRHAAFFLELAETKQTQLQGVGAKECLDLIEGERPNFLAALDWLDRSENDPLLGLRLSGALWRFWSIRGPLTEGQTWLTRTLERASVTGEATEAEARAYNGLGVLYRVQGDKRQARELNQQALAIWRRLGDTRGIAASLNNIGGGMIETGDYEAALPLLEESLGLWRLLEKPIAVAQLLQNLAFLACERGDFVAFAPLCAESLALFRSAGDQHGISNILSIQALTANKQGDFSQAAAFAAESIRISADLGSIRDAVYTLETLAEALGGLGEAQKSVVLLGVAGALRVSVEENEDDTRVEKILAHLRLTQSETAIQSALAHGRSLTPEQAVALALETAEEVLPPG